MTPELLEYIKHPGLNSTLLGKFADDPLVAVAKTQDKTYFQAGKAFERCFEDRITGSSKFSEKFFISENIKIPDSFLKVYKSKEPLTSHFVFTKKREFNKTKESLHDTIFQCITDELYFSNKRRYPIPLEEYQAMQLSIDRLLKMEVELYPGEFYQVERMLKDNKSLFQYPIYWTANGLQKKALYDIIVFLERGDGLIVPLDLKFMQNLNAMGMFFRNTMHKYSIQSMHYQEGIDHVEEFEEFDKYPQMPFLVATKADPHYVQPFLMDDSSLEYAYDDYVSLCYECSAWIEKGKPTTGIKPTRRVKIWSN